MDVLLLLSRFLAWPAGSAGMTCATLSRCWRAGALLSLAGLVAAGCNAPPLRPPERGPIACADSVDNDGDGLVDCADPDCLLEPACAALRAVDLLFVVDHGADIAAEQAALAAAFRRMLDSLQQAGGLPDLHVGVLSSDLGSGGFEVEGCETRGTPGRLAVARAPGCPAPVDPWIAHVSGMTNVGAPLPVGGPVIEAGVVDATPDGGSGGAPSANETIDRLVAAFACIAPGLTEGCRFRQPLEAVRRALDPHTNPGFVRPGSILALVILARDDDCSASDGSEIFDPTQTGPASPLGPLEPFRCFEFGVTCDISSRHLIGPRSGCSVIEGGDLLRDVGEYARDLSALRSDALVAVVAGPTDRVEVERDQGVYRLAPSCTGSVTEGRPAFRLEEFVRQIGPRRGFSSAICDGPAAALAALAARINAARGR